MELLFELDLHDYELGDNVFSRPSARGVIFDDCGRIALVYSQKEKYYKFPGGGILSGEDKKEAIDTNLKYKTEDFFDEIMIKRETKLLQMLKKKRGTLDNILFC